MAGLNQLDDEERNTDVPEQKATIILIVTGILLAIVIVLFAR
jgi:hypothetical protein